jgi:propionyl-CoA carboxylase beta chain
MALRNRAPIIGLYDAGGARIQEGVASLGGYAEVFQRNVCHRGDPADSVIMGPCAGRRVFAGDDRLHLHGAWHELHVRHRAGRREDGHNETVTAEELGGASIHSVRSSIADGAFDDDLEALLEIRRLFDFLPLSNVSELPVIETSDLADRIELSLDTLVPDLATKPYDMKELISKVLDEGAFFEIQEAHARNIVTGFGRIEGRTIGVVANQPMVLAGVLDSDASRKAARFVRFCDCFSIPILTFVDVPGFLPGTAQEYGGLIKHGAKLLFAYAEATVPKITVITRKGLWRRLRCHGVEASARRHQLCLADAQIAVMGAKGAVEIIYRQDAGDPDKIAAHTQAYEARFLNPFVPPSAVISTT